MGDYKQGGYEVYTGTWTNWSKGAILGRTLTLARHDANLLIAFVAFFTVIAGACLWRIVCLSIHFSLSCEKPGDGLHHERQILLRNATDASSGIFLMSKLIWSWRGRESRPLRRVGVLLVLSVMCSAGIILASGFSSSVSSAVGDEVLLQGKNCVIVSFASLPDNVTGADFEALAGYTTQKIQNAASLADQCVEGGAPRALACDFFSTRRLPLEIFDTSAPCPFDEKICVSRDGNLVIDTGLIDSHEHLGINAHPSERFAFRRKIHCAPLTTKGYTEDVVDASGEVTKTRYSYGRQWSSTERANFTYEYINRPANRTPTQTASDYTLGVRYSSYSDESSEESPLSDVDVIPELRVPEADIHLYFLSTNDIFFNNRSEDPWYRITRENWYNISDSAMLDIVNDPLQKVWVQAEAASPLGCILQEQYCNPNRPQSDQEKCGPLSAPGYAEERALSAGVFDDTEGMRVRLGWLTSGWGSASNPIFLIRILGSYALKGRRALLDSSQGVVPRNQWTLDVEYWHRMAMASIQAGLIETAAGPSDRKVDVFYTKRPQKAEETKLCNGQKIRSANYESFSVLGLSIIFGVGAFIVIVSYTLEHFLRLLAERFGIQRPQYLEWRANEILQLQRQVGDDGVIRRGPY